jgi:hypothetical protein
MDFFADCKPLRSNSDGTPDDGMARPSNAEPLQKAYIQPMPICAAFEIPDMKNVIGFRHIEDGGDLRQ